MIVLRTKPGMAISVASIQFRTVSGGRGTARPPDASAGRDDDSGPGVAVGGQQRGVAAEVAQPYQVGVDRGVQHDWSDGGAGTEPHALVLADPDVQLTAAAVRPSPLQYDQAFGG